MSPATFTLPEAARFMRAYRRAFRHTFIWHYAFQIGDDGPIKLGVTLNPSQRLATLQQANPEKLRPIACWRDPAEMEAVMHQAFATDRIRGEWFRPSADVLAHAEFHGDDWCRWRNAA